eukprot:m.21103 g.21103  ORF g.21103 m.21103 type:complete len:489 (+) comp5325_c0_seq2:103-1569(+)
MMEEQGTTLATPEATNPATTASAPLTAVDVGSSKSSTEQMKKRKALYRQIVGQLLHDGLESLAQELCAKEIISGVLPNDALLQSFIAPFEEAPNQGQVDSTFLLNSNIDGPSTAITYKEVNSVRQSANCTAAAFSCDGSIVAIGAADGLTRIYDMDKIVSDHSQEVLCVIPSEAFAPVSSIAISPNVALVAVGFQSGELRVYSISTGSPRLETTQEDFYKMNSLDFHPSGQFLLVATSHTNVRMFHTKTWACYTATTSAPHTAPLTQARYNHNATKYASSDLAGCIKLWDVVSSTCVHTFTNLFDGSPCTSIEFSTSDEYLLAGTTQEASVLLNVESGVKIACFNPLMGVSSLCPMIFGVDENSVIGYAGVGGVVQLWHTSSGERLDSINAHSSPIEHIAVNRARRVLLTCGRGKEVSFWVLSEKVFGVEEEEEEQEEQEETYKPMAAADDPSDLTGTQIIVKDKTIPETPAATTTMDQTDDSDITLQ